MHFPPLSFSSSFSSFLLFSLDSHLKHDTLVSWFACNLIVFYHGLTETSLGFVDLTATPLLTYHFSRATSRALDSQLSIPHYLFSRVLGLKLDMLIFMLIWLQLCRWCLFCCFSSSHCHKSLWSWILSIICLVHNLIFSLILDFSYSAHNLLLRFDIWLL